MKDDRTWSAELRDHGAAIGVEAQILCDGELILARTFRLGAPAEAWGRQERQLIEQGRYDDFI